MIERIPSYVYRSGRLKINGIDKEEGAG